MFVSVCTLKGTEGVGCLFSPFYAYSFEAASLPDAHMGLLFLWLDWKPAGPDDLPISVCTHPCPQMALGLQGAGGYLACSMAAGIQILVLVWGVGGIGL